MNARKIGDGGSATPPSAARRLFPSSPVDNQRQKVAAFADAPNPLESENELSDGDILPFENLLFQSMLAKKVRDTKIEDDKKSFISGNSRGEEVGRNHETSSTSDTQSHRDVDPDFACGDLVGKFIYRTN